MDQEEKKMHAFKLKVVYKNRMWKPTVYVPDMYVLTYPIGLSVFFDKNSSLSLIEYATTYMDYMEPLLALCSIQRGSRLGLGSAFKKFPEELARMLKDFLY